MIFTLEFRGGKLTVSWLRDGFGCPRGVFLGCMDPTVYAVSVWGVVDCYKKRFTILTTVPTVQVQVQVQVQYHVWDGVPPCPGKLGGVWTRDSERCQLR